MATWRTVNGYTRSTASEGQAELGIMDSSRSKQALCDKHEVALHRKPHKLRNL